MSLNVLILEDKFRLEQGAHNNPTWHYNGEFSTHATKNSVKAP